VSYGKYQIKGAVMRYITIVISLLSVTCCAFAQEAGKGWLQFDLKKTQVGMAMVYYDPIYEGKLDFVKASLRELISGIESRSALLAKKDAIIDDINAIIGETEPDKAMQASFLDKFTGSFREINQMTFYLVSAEKAKEFQRKGGTLPDCTYDKETDTCSYEPKFGIGSAEGSLKSLELAIPIKSEKEFEKEIDGFIEAISGLTGAMMDDVAIHEVAEITLQRRIKARNPYLRWFADGAANAIAYEILKKHISQKHADEFLKEYDIAPYKELTAEINLQYWMLLKYCINADNRIKFDELEFPRYCFATHEMRRLIEKHGIGCIKEIADEMHKSKTQGDTKLLDTIKEVTGEDIAERLKRYQTFETRQDGMKKYAPKVEEAMKNKDKQAFIANTLRVLEMYENPYNIDSLTARKMIAQVLARSGKEKLGDNIMNNFLEMLSDVPIDKAKEISWQLFMDYALNTGRPGIAITQAEDTLKVLPDYVPALGIKMFTLANDGKILEAEPLAKKIRNLAKEGSPFYEMAGKVLEEIAKKPQSKPQPASKQGSDF